MHILDGVLGTPVVAVTSVAAAGLVGWSLKGLKERELPKVALMSAVFFVGSMIHVNIGGSSVHLMLNGITGLMLGRRTPAAIAVSLILQLLIIQFGGLTSLGANIIDVSLSAMLAGYLIRPYIGKNPARNFACGAAAGGLSVVVTIILVSIMLIESNMRFGFGPFNAIEGLMLGHIPVVIIEAIVTGFAVQMIAQIRPEMLNLTINAEGKEDKQKDES